MRRVWLVLALIPQGLALYALKYIVTWESNNGLVEFLQFAVYMVMGTLIGIIMMCTIYWAVSRKRPRDLETTPTPGRGLY